MSHLLDALILQRKQEAVDYKKYLARVVELTKMVSKPETQSSYPTSINTTALRSLYDNLEEVRVRLSGIDRRSTATGRQRT